MEFTRSEAKAWSLEHIKGFYMCPLSPVNDALKIDEAQLRDNIEQFIGMGIEGLVMGGFIAECWNVTMDNWKWYHEVVADAVKGRADLWTIILDPCVHTALEKADFVEKLGFNGAEVINPVVQLRTDDEIFDWFKYFTDRTDLGVCLYRTPVSGKVLTFDLMQRLADIDTIVGVKQGHLSRAETLKLRKLIRDDFIVSEPMEAFFCDDLRLGGQVCWGELSYILYGKQRYLVDEYRKQAAAGDWTKAYETNAKLEPVRELYGDLFLWEVARTATYASALANMKAWFEVIGLNAGRMIPPVREAGPETKDYIEGKLKELNVI